MGVLVGPPAAGALYERWGFRAPFIFGIIITFVDLLARLLIIERKDAIKWGVDPAAYTSHSDDNSPPADSEAAAVTTEVQHTQSEKPESSPPSVTPAVTSYTPLGLLWRLLRSSRAMICILNTLVYGYVSLQAILNLLEPFVQRNFHWAGGRFDFAPAGDMGVKSIPSRSRFHCCYCTDVRW